MIIYTYRPSLKDSVDWFIFNDIFTYLLLFGDFLKF
jgi:hypothetical protein